VLAILVAVAATDASGYSIIGPVLPHVQATTGASVTVLSLLAACFPLAMLGGLVLAGRLAHAGRTRSAILVGLVLLMIGTVAFALGSSLWLLFAARSVMGFGSGCVWIGLTLRTLEYWPGHEYVQMSRIFAGYSIGSLVGPALAALGGVRVPFLAYAVLLVGCVPVVMVLPEPAVRQELHRDRTVLRTSGFWFAALAILLAMIAFGTLDGVLPLHFATRLSQAQIGVAYTLTGLLVAVAAAAAGRVRPRAALLVGGIGTVLGISLAGATGTVLAWAVALVLVGLGAGGAETGATGVLLQAVPSERIVSAMVVWSQVGMLGYLIAPVLGGQVVARFGFAWLGLVPLAAAAAVVVAAAAAHRSPARAARPGAPQPDGVGPRAG
jgi:MFS family permease